MIIAILKIQTDENDQHRASDNERWNLWPSTQKNFWAKDIHVDPFKKT